MTDNDLNQLFEYFAGLTGRAVPQDVQEIWKLLCYIKVFPPKTVLLKIGGVPQEFYFIINGLCRQYYKTDSGREVTRGFVAERELCGPDILIESENAAFCVETLEECRMLTFRPDEMKRLLSHSIYMRDVLINGMKRDIRRRIWRERSLTSSSSSERYQEFVAKYPNLAERVKQVHLASYLGINHVTLSRIRGPLREEKKIRAKT